MRRTIIGTVLGSAIFVTGLLAMEPAAPAGGGAATWHSWSQRQPVSLEFQQRRIEEVLKDILQQANVSALPDVGPFLAGESVGGPIRKTAFWPAIAALANLANAQIAVERDGARRTLLCLDKRSFQTPDSRQFSFAGPFCFELSRLTEKASPEEIKNTWRVRSLGLPEDGGAAVAKVLVTDRQTSQVTDCELLRISDCRGDIIRTIGGGTYDQFFKLPEYIEKHGFSCKIHVFMTEVSQWTWVSLPLHQGAAIRAKHVTLQVQDIFEEDGDVNVTYKMQWSPGIPQEAIAEWKRLTEKVRRGTTATVEERLWMKKNRIANMTIRDWDVTTNDHRRLSPKRTSLSQEPSGPLEEPKLSGRFCISKASLSGNVSQHVLRLQIADERSVATELSFSVPPANAGR